MSVQQACLIHYIVHTQVKCIDYYIHRDLALLWWPTAFDCIRCFFFFQTWEKGTKIKESIRIIFPLPPYLSLGMQLLENSCSCYVLFACLQRSRLIFLQCFLPGIRAHQNSVCWVGLDWSTWVLHSYVLANALKVGQCLRPHRMIGWIVSRRPMSIGFLYRKTKQRLRCYITK